jgi:DNA repair photolyase
MHNSDRSIEEYLSEVKKNRNISLRKNIVERILNEKSNGRMFSIVTTTWNPVSGCLYNCNYCWARELATTKLKNSHRYSKGFKPSLNVKEFSTKFAKNDLVFVCDMGDMFADFISDEWIKRVLDHTRKFPETDFLFMTKNPRRYIELLGYIPENAILGATIETNDDEIVKTDKISNAPSPSQRYKAMKTLNWPRKMVSIEPILDFDLNTFSRWIKDINPLIVFVGYDNYCHKLREPTLTQTNRLLSKLSENSLVVKKTIRSAWYEDN